MTIPIARELTAMLLLFGACARADSTKKFEHAEKARPSDAVFIPDSFENRDDTASFNIKKGNLAGQPQTLALSFGAVACTCAQWLETKHSKSPGTREYFFLEPATGSLTDADTLFQGSNLPVKISVFGQFYAKKGYPQNYRPAKGGPKPARVFRYTKIKVLSLGTSL